MLCDRVSRTVRRYLSDLDNTSCQEGLYELLMREVERPLLIEVMKWHDGNQSRAATTLGINRATLRKKLLQHGLA
ncbi:MAG: DNA-binding protein [Xanthomonadales bacterium]|nr:DNA-binding protein [Xanthomonadales bacterium]